MASLETDGSATSNLNLFQGWDVKKPDGRIRCHGEVSSSKMQDKTQVFVKVETGWDMQVLDSAWQ